ncbi:MAG: cupin domain-containing protein [Planctomycetota bacterium]|nr:cupin domain-containing protein [Planctomycetota bacterium]
MGTGIRVVDLKQSFDSFTEQWSPRIAAELNGQQVRLAKIQGEFVWHSHDDEDELFLVIKGAMRLEFRDGAVDLKEGQFVVVPRGVEHKPSAEEECAVLLFEPAQTKHTGNVMTEKTKTVFERL